MSQLTPASNSTGDGVPASGRSTLDTLRRSMRGWLNFKVGFAILVLGTFTIFALFSPWIVPHSPDQQDLMAALTPPQYFSGPYFLGTDHVGRDILSRLIYGARISLLIAVVVVVISGVFGVGLGLISGFFGRWIDFAIQKLVEVFWAFPPLLLAVTIVAFFGQGLGVLIIALVVQRWIPYCRVTRANTMSLKEREYVLAARSIGASRTRIMVKHILPNLIQSSIIIGTFAMASAILSEAALSFLGLGVPPTIPTLGAMLNDARSYMSTSWWMPLFPGACIFLTVLAINMLGDALRDQLDPRLKRSGAKG